MAKEYTVQGRFSCGWEDVITSDTRKEARGYLRDYDTNDRRHAYRIVTRVVAEPLTAFEYEHTDTFGGEANYCWVNRGTVTARSLDHAVRLAKAKCGLTGVRCKREEYYGVGGAILRPCGVCQIMFVTYRES